MKSKVSVLNASLLRKATFEALLALNPLRLTNNPVILCTWLGALIATASLAWHFSVFELQVVLWLWITVFFANLAESLATCLGKAQVESLRRSKISVVARRFVNNREEHVPANALNVGDIVVCEAGDYIPADGDVVEGIASVDESAITGESAPVIRESGEDRSSVTGGTRVLSDRLLIRVTFESGQSFLNRMISLIESTKRHKTPNEQALSMLLIALTVVLIVSVFSIYVFAQYIGLKISIISLVALWICLIPTTIGSLLIAIRIAGMDRLLQFNVVAKNGQAIETAGNTSILLFDKTGTITLGNRMAAEFIPCKPHSTKELAHAAFLASLADETAEGRSIMALAKEHYQFDENSQSIVDARFVAFSASTRVSGIDFPGNCIRKGAVDAIKAQTKKDQFPQELEQCITNVCQQGGTPLAVIKNNEVMGIIYLKDIIKTGLKERFSKLYQMGIKTVMMTGDNPLTAAAITAEVGISDFMAEATPETKLLEIKRAQHQGHLVAMTGDGTNDAPALAQSDVGLVMSSGTQEAREAGNMIDLDNDPSKILDVITTGKELLMTRGALTTFSLANDVAKYFAILPAMFGSLFAFNIDLMGLGSAQSAILSSVIYNALIIVFLTPLALKGVSYKALPSRIVLRNNMLIYGLGGIVAPFVGIKLIDYLVRHWV